ncbi:MAG: hypothetical protein KAR11_01330 [Phycisphaerae bacterium]|nr:hypothetical protein [Phycisphaerae bacterium]
MQKAKFSKWISVGLVFMVLSGTSALQAAGERTAASGQGVLLKPTWYNPQEIRPQKRYPLAVVLASPGFSGSATSYWVKNLWKKGFCILVLEGDSDVWAKAQVSDITAAIAQAPALVQPDLNRLLIVADTTTGSQALQMIDRFPKKIVGAALVSVAPVRIVGRSFGLWEPRKESQKIPLWIVQGTKPGEAAERLVMWRKSCSNLPSINNVTIDARVGRGPGNLLPGIGAETWLSSIAAGKIPAKGLDSQAQAEIRNSKQLVKNVKKLLNQNFPKSNAKKITKTDGKLKMSVTPPANWERLKELEHPYNPKGLPADANGKEFKTPGPQYFSNIYLTPFKKSPFFARVCTAELKHTGKNLIGFYQQQLRKKGYLVVPLWSGKKNGRVYNLSSILYLWRGKWHKWVVLMGTPENSKTTAPLVLVLDAGVPTPKKLVAAMKQLIGTVKVY